MRHLCFWAMFDSFSSCKRWWGKSENYLCPFRQSIIYSPSSVQKCDSTTGSQEKGLSCFNVGSGPCATRFRIQIALELAPKLALISDMVYYLPEGDRPWGCVRMGCHRSGDSGWRGWPRSWCQSLLTPHQTDICFLWQAVIAFLPPLL